MSDLRCWMCNGLGAIKPWGRFPPVGIKLWLPFRPEPQGNIRLDRDEHVCPACGGAGNPEVVL